MCFAVRSSLTVLLVHCGLERRIRLAALAVVVLLSPLPRFRLNPPAVRTHTRRLTAHAAAPSLAVCCAPRCCARIEVDTRRRISRALLCRPSPAPLIASSIFTHRPAADSARAQVSTTHAAHCARVPLHGRIQIRFGHPHDVGRGGWAAVRTARRAGASCSVDIGGDDDEDGSPTRITN